MKPRLLIDANNFQITINRLCFQLIENHGDFSDTVIIGIQPRGVFLAERIHSSLTSVLKKDIPCGNLDITFFRDDFRKHKDPLIPSATRIDFIIEDKRVILIDDVLYTGRTIRAALDALMAFGRPQSVELLVLINRRYSRHLPIEPNYTGQSIDSIASESVKVKWKETDGKDEVWLVQKNEELNISKQIHKKRI